MRLKIFNVLVKVFLGEENF